MVNKQKYCFYCRKDYDLAFNIIVSSKVKANRYQQKHIDLTHHYNSTIITNICYFKNVGESLPEGDTISSCAVNSEVECSFQCLQTSTCIGYNYRPKSKNYAENCQLSSKTQDAYLTVDAIENWEFYQDSQMARKKISEIPLSRKNRPSTSNFRIKYAFENKVMEKLKLNFMLF